MNTPASLTHAPSQAPAHAPARTPSRASWLSLRRLKRPLKWIVAISLTVTFVPYWLAFYVACGLLDYSRNTDKSFSSLERYLFGNGLFTWLVSPFNLLMDLLCVPFRNKGIYQLSDLPASYQEEINGMIAAVHKHNLIGQLESRLGNDRRGMMFFKWYGKNVPTSVDIPEFHRPFKHIRTIGVSIFNKRQSTGRHFGPLRVTLRVLYNINPIDSDNVYIRVGDHTNHWRDNQLFIFDDTLQHQSHNQSDEVRYCMFVDILRPSLVPRLLSAILTGVRTVVAPFNSVFYKKWTFVE